MKRYNMVNKMTLEEKAALLSGKNEWQSRDIPRLAFRPLPVPTDLTGCADRKEQGITSD